MLADLLDVTGSALLAGVVLIVLAGAGLFLRHSVLARSGASVHCGLRLAKAHHTWHYGLIRYSAAQLQWFRLFSLSPRPARVFVRRGSEVRSRREPQRLELNLVPQARVVARCFVTTAGGEQMEVELAMGADAWTGFLAWLESAPPGVAQTSWRREL